MSRRSKWLIVHIHSTRQLSVLRRSYQCFCTLGRLDNLQEGYFMSHQIALRLSRLPVSLVPGKFTAIATNFTPCRTSKRPRVPIRAMKLIFEMMLPISSKIELLWVIYGSPKRHAYPSMHATVETGRMPSGLFTRSPQVSAIDSVIFPELCRPAAFKLEQVR
jgi:hypothetical protein